MGQTENNDKREMAVFLLLTLLLLSLLHTECIYGCIFFSVNEKLTSTNGNGGHNRATQPLNKDLVDVVDQVSGTK